MPQGRFHTDKSGNRFGLLTLVTKLDQKNSNGSYRYIVQCDCGESKAIYYNQMASGRSKSCGCLSRRQGKDSPNWKHGLADKSHPLNKKYQREAYDRFKYGLEPEHKQALLDKQSGCCAICGYKFGQKKGDIKVDHCHTNGDVRGLLCDLCNRGIGMLKDSTKVLANAIQYLNANAR